MKIRGIGESYYDAQTEEGALTFYQSNQAGLATGEGSPEDKVMQLLPGGQL